MKLLSLGVIAASSALLSSLFIYRPASSEPAQIAYPKSSPFKFEDYPDQNSLEILLKGYFSPQTSIEEIDHVLVEQGKSFRSANLILDTPNGSDYRAGGSSAENYVFYFKPDIPAGEFGWEKAESGWVLKVTYLGGGLKFSGGDTHKTPERLIKIEVLSSPSKRNPDSIKTAKGLLQDKLDAIPVNHFSEEQWQDLKRKFSKSPCMANPSFECLVESSITVLDLENNPLAVLYYPPLATIIISEGHSSLAKTLLSSWPDQDQIIKFEEGLPRTKRYGAAMIKSQWEHYTDLKMQLLYLAGEYEQADKILAKSHLERRNGEDFGAIASLTSKGDLDKALEIANHSLTWPLEGRDPREGSSMIMHCNTYDPYSRATAMGKLGLKFIEKDAREKAREVSNLLKTYIENEAYGQKSHCHVDFANHSYNRIMESLILHHAGQQDFEAANSLLNEQVSVLIEQLPKVTNFNYNSFERLAKLGAKIGHRESISRLIGHAQLNSEINYTDLFGSDPHDPLVVMLALTGDYTAALQRMSEIDYAKGPMPSYVSQALPPSTRIPDNIIKLNSLMRAAEALKAIGDTDGAVLFIDKAHSMMGQLDSGYDSGIENLQNYITRANMFYELGLKDRGKIAADEAINRFARISAGEVTQIYVRDMALLIARSGNVQDLQSWADKLHYDGPSYATIGKLLVEEKRWDELDVYMPEMARVFSADNNPPGNWHHFTHALIEAGEFDRYSRFVSLVQKGTPEEEKRIAGGRQQVYPADYAKPKYTRYQVWLTIDLMIQKMSGREIPAVMISSMFSQYLDNCPENPFSLPKRGRDKANAADTMASSCLLRIVQSYQAEKQDRQIRQELHNPF